MSLLSPGDIAGMHTVLTELSNATLLAVESPGALTGNGDPGTPVTVWTGSAPAFLNVDDADILSASTEINVLKTTLRVFDQAGAPPGLMRAGADWTAATVIVADTRGTTTVTQRWTVIELIHESDQTLNSVLLTLNAPRPTT